MNLLERINEFDRTISKRLTLKGVSEEFNTCHKGAIKMLENVAPIVGYIVESQ